MTDTLRTGAVLPAREAPSSERHASRTRYLVRDLIRYFGVSAVALGVDYGLLIILHRVGALHYLVAATLSFIAGLTVAWALSITFVFTGRRRLSAWREVGGFVATGLAGLVLTQAALACLVGGLGAPPELAKIPVAGGVFLFNFASRRLLFLAPANA